jgi:hypothetical protein
MDEEEPASTEGRRAMINPTAPAPRKVGAVYFAGHISLVGVHALFGREADPPGGRMRLANAPRPQRLDDERAGTAPTLGKERQIRLFAQDRGPAAQLIESGDLERAGDHIYDPALVSTGHLEWTDPPDAVTTSAKAS